MQYLRVPLARILLGFALLALAACVDEDSKPKPKSEATIVQFHADPSTIKEGESTTLHWVTRGAKKVILLENGVKRGEGSLPPSGSLVVTPAGTTVYRLEAADKAGRIVDTSIEVAVEPFGAPRIDAFVAYPTLVQRGEPVTLSWKVRGAESLEIVSELGGRIAYFVPAPPSGSHVVRPTDSGVFVLRARNGEGLTTEQVEVTVATRPVVTLAFDADKPDYGAEVELSWTVSNAETIGILNPLGEVLFEGPAEKGSLRFPAEIPGEYRATAVGVGGEEQATARLDIQPRIDEFEVLVFGEARPGTPALARWDVKGATRIVISNGIEDVVETREPTGAQEVQVADGGAFILRAYSGSALAEKTTAVQVVGTPVIRSITTGPKVTAGQGIVGVTTVAWEVDGASKILLEVEPGGIVDTSDKSPRNDEVEVLFRGPGTVKLTAFNAAGSETVIIPSPVDPVPTIQSLFAAPSRVATGEFTKIYWTTLDAKKVVLERDGVALPVAPGAVNGEHTTEEPVTAPTSFVLRAINGLGFEVVSDPIVVEVGPPNQLFFDTKNGQRLFRVGSTAEVVWKNDGGNLLIIKDELTNEQYCSFSDWRIIREGSCTIPMPTEQRAVPLLLEVSNGAGTDVRRLDLQAVRGPIILAFEAETSEITEGDSLLFTWRAQADAEGNIPTLSLTDDKGNVYDMSDVVGQAALEGSKRFRIHDWGAEPRTFTLTATSPVPPPYSTTAQVQVYGVPTVDDMVASPPFAASEGDMVHVRVQTTHAVRMRMHHLAENGTVDVDPFFDSAVEGQFCLSSEPLQFECTVPLVPTIALPHVRIVAINPLGVETTADLRVGVAPATVEMLRVNGQDAEVVDLLENEEIVLEWEVARADDQVLRESFFDLSERPTATLLVDWSGSTGTTSSALLNFPGGFVFPYMGAQMRQANVMVAGYITFDIDQGTGNVTNSAFPYQSTTVAIQAVDIAPFWETQRKHQVWYELIRGEVDRLIIQWSGGEITTSNGNPASLEYQLVLFADGRIEFHYGNMDTPNAALGRGSSATAGMQNHSCNGPCREGFTLFHNEEQKNGLEGRMVRFHGFAQLDEKGSTPVPMPPSGTMTFRATEDRTYTLRAWNGHSEHTRSVEVRVHPRAVLDVWTEPAEPRPGDLVTLHWAGTNLTSLVLEDAQGNQEQVAPQGSTSLGVLAEGTYHFTFRGEGQIARDVVERTYAVSVHDDFALESFTADSNRIKLGEEVTLSWTTTSATSARIIDRTTGAVHPIPAGDLDSGSMKLSPQRTTTYELEVESHERYRRAELTVEVRTVWVDSFSASQTVVPSGAPVTLSWNTTMEGTVRLADHLTMVEVDAPFEDISLVPNRMVIHGQNVAGTVTRFDFPIDFSFPFFDQTYNAIMVSADGFAGFDFSSTTATPTNRPIPSSIAADRRANLAVFWDDLHTGNGSVIAARLSNPDRLVIQWDGVRRNAPATDWDLNFQIVLYPTGAFEYRYGTMKPPSTPGTTSQCNPVDCTYEAAGSSATIGFHDPTGTKGFELHYGATTSSAVHDPFPGGLQNRSFRYDPVLANGTGSLTVRPRWPTTYTLCIEEDGWKECSDVFVNVVNPGDLAITELLVAPTQGVAGQWFEVRNLTGGPIDLNGAVIRSGSQSHTIQNGGPLVVPMGGHVVFARTDEPYLAPDYVYGADIELGAVGDLVLEWNGIPAGKVEWDASWPIQTGVALQLRGDRARPGVEERVADDYCAATQSYDGQNVGTPGAISDCVTSGYLVDFFSDKPFIDIRSIGSRSGYLNSNDKASYLTAGLGFTVPFFDSTYDQLWMNSNGLVGFVGTGDASNLNRDLYGSQTNVNTGIIAAYWDDLTPSDDRTSWVGFHLMNVGGVQVRIVQWDGVKRIRRPGSLTFQVQIWENGDIVLAYKDLRGGYSYFGGEATIGIEAPGGTSAIQYLWNEPILRPNQSIYFQKR